MKLFELMKKNFRLLLRSKTSSLVIFIGPLVLVLLLGLAYSQSSSFTLTAAVYSPGYSELSESLISKLDNQDFNVLRYETLDNCVNSVKRGESQACILFPPDMHVESGKTNEVTFYVDYSQINLVWLILDVMSARVSERSDELSKELTSDLLERLWFVEDRLKQGKTDSDAVKSEAFEIKGVAGNMKGNVQSLDIAVDFSGIVLAEGDSATAQIQGLLDDMRAEMDNLTSSAKTYSARADQSITSIEGDVNSSSVLADLDIIDDAIDDIQASIDSSAGIVDSSAANITVQLSGIGTVLESVRQNLESTKARIDSAKSRRDEILPEFDSIGENVDSLTDKVAQLQMTLDDGLEKISSLKMSDAQSIVAPISTKIEPVSSQKTHFNSLFPTLLTLIIMITGILLSATLVIVEKRSKAFFRNNMTPTSYAMFSVSTYMTTLFIMLIQLLLFVSISAFFFETEVITSIALLLLIVFVVCSVFICVGMFVGFVFRTEETANLAAITLATIFLLFSSAVIPLESMPVYFRDIAMLNPFVLGELALKQALVFGMGISKIGSALGLLGGYAVGVFALLLALQKVMRRILFMQFSRPSAPAVVSTKKASKKMTSEDERHDIDELHVGD